MTPARIEEIIHDLQGTCQSLDDALEEGEDATDPVLCAAIDEAIFLCPGCNWWCERSEGHENPTGDEDLCDDCFDGDTE